MIIKTIAVKVSDWVAIKKVQLPPPKKPNVPNMFHNEISHSRQDWHLWIIRELIFRLLFLPTDVACLHLNERMRSRLKKSGANFKGKQLIQYFYFDEKKYWRERKCIVTMLKLTVNEKTTIEQINTNPKGIPPCRREHILNHSPQQWTSILPKIRRQFKKTLKGNFCSLPYFLPHTHDKNNRKRMPDIEIGTSASKDWGQHEGKPCAIKCLKWVSTNKLCFAVA